MLHRQRIILRLLHSNYENGTVVSGKPGNHYIYKLNLEKVHYEK